MLCQSIHSDDWLGILEERDAILATVASYSKEFIVADATTWLHFAAGLADMFVSNITSVRLGG